MQLPSDDGALSLQTGFGQRHPYGSVNSLGVKPYMSQPMLANGLVHGGIGEDDLEGRRSLDFTESVFEDTGGLRTATAGRLGQPMRGPASPKPLGPPTTSISSTQNSAAHLDKRANGGSHRAGPSHASLTFKKKSTHSKSISSAIVNRTTQTGFAFVGVEVGVEVGANAVICDERGSIGQHVADDVANRSLERERSLFLSTRTAQNSITGAGLNSENGIRSQETLPSASPSADISETNHQLLNPHAVPLERKPSSIFKTLPDLPGEILMTAGPASSSCSVDSASMDVDNEMSSTAAIMSDSAPTSTVGDVRLTADMSASIPIINIIHNTTSTVTTPTIKPTMTAPTFNDATTTFIIDDLHNETDLPKLSTIIFPPKRSMSTGAPLPTTQKPLRLSLSALNRRLSFGITEGSARLSPSIIIRPPPLPLINLPVLTTPGGSRRTAIMAEDRDERNVRRQSRLGLRSIPALPLRGTSRGTRGHEEVDDLEEDDEDDDDDDDDDREITRNTAEATGRSFDSERSTDDDDNVIVVEKLSASVPTRTSSRTSSYVTARAEPSPTISDSYFGNGSTRPPEKPFSKTPQSPLVDAPAFELDFSLVIDQGPSPSPSENTRPGELLQMRGSVDKGKARQKDEEVIIGDVFPGRTLDSQDYGYGHRDCCVPDRAQVDRSKVVGVSGEQRVVGGCSGLHLFPSNPVIPGGFRTEGGDNTDYSRYSVLPPSPRPRPEMPVPCGVLSTSGEESLAMTTPLPRQPKLESVSITTITSKASRMSVNSGVGITQHAGMYKRASQSLVNVRAIQTKEMVENMVKDHEEEEERKRAVRMSMKVLGGVDEEKRMVQEVKNYDNSQPSLSGGFTLHKPDTTTSRSSIMDEKGSLHPLRRRLSMPTSTPPPYSSLPFHPSGGLTSPPTILPYEDEGMEKLPSYTNGIYLHAIMPRKMEFSSPGVQAKDRKWRRVLCVLEGTVFKVYKCTPSAAGVSSIGGWWESKVGVGDSSADLGNQVASPTAQDRNSSAPAWDIEPARAKDDGDEGSGTGQPALEGSSPTEQLQLPSPPPQRKPHGHSSSHSLGVIPTTKSALTFAVQLLKPQAKHTRSNSDVAVRYPQAQSPRSSLNIPRSGRSTPATSNHGSVSMRSPSPTASSSTHISTPPSSAVVSQPSRSSTPALSGNERPASAECKDKKNSVDMADPIRVYTMQHAESGLGKDYTKRQHVIRVRLEGEQFLIQAKGVDDVIAWIEVSVKYKVLGAGDGKGFDEILSQGLQAAANVALDLDERPMPTGPLFPRFVHFQVLYYQ